MDKSIASKKPTSLTKLGDRRQEYSDTEIDFILMGGRVIKNAVKRDIRIIATIDGKEITSRIRGESVLTAINRLNLREHEIEYIIENTITKNTLESETIESGNTNLIYSKHEEEYRND